MSLVGLALLAVMSSGDDYWRLCLPGMVLYIAGIGTVYFVGNVTVVATADAETQGTVSGVYNVSAQVLFLPPFLAGVTDDCNQQMFLNVGGAVLGVALLTVINDSVASKHGGPDDPDAALAGYRAGYYGAIAMSVIGLVCSVFFTHPKKKEVGPVTRRSSEELPSGDTSENSQSKEKVAQSV